MKTATFTYDLANGVPTAYVVTEADAAIDGCYIMTEKMIRGFEDQWASANLAKVGDVLWYNNCEQGQPQKILHPSNSYS